jgi:hypothetical protein
MHHNAYLKDIPTEYNNDIQYLINTTQLWLHPSQKIIVLTTFGKEASPPNCAILLIK